MTQSQHAAIVNAAAQRRLSMNSYALLALAGDLSAEAIEAERARMEKVRRGN